MQTSSSDPATTPSGNLPNQGTDAIEILKSDHVLIKSLLAQLTSPNANGSSAMLLEQLKSVLTLHNAVEENLVYPAIALVAGRRMQSQNLYHETAAADLMVFELDQLAHEGNDKKFKRRAKQLQDAILEHISDEEDKAFVQLQKHADPEEQQLLTTKVREFRDALSYKKA